MRKRDLCIILILHETSMPHKSPTDSFIVTHSLSTAWSTETVLPTDSQVVTLLVWGFKSPFNPVCGPPLVTLGPFSASHSSLFGALPWWLRLIGCGCSHGSIATKSRWQSSNVVVGLPICGPILLSWHNACEILVSSFLIPSFINMLSYFSRTRSSLNSWSSRFPRWMASWICICLSSCGCITSSLWSSCVVAIMGMIAWGFVPKVMALTLLDVFRTISMLKFLHMAL